MTQLTKERIIEHCRWISTFDRAEAVRAFNWYTEMLPWLELKKK